MKRYKFERGTNMENVRTSNGEESGPSWHYEMFRFYSLRSFPKENKPYIIRLAAAGFYYENTEDEVVCYCCALRIRNWCENDNPMEKHRKLNPNCSFFLKNSEVNVPVIMSATNQDITRITRPKGCQNTNLGADTNSTINTMSNHTITSACQSALTTSTYSQNSIQAVSTLGNLSIYPISPTNNAFLSSQMKPTTDRNSDQTVQTNSITQERESNHITNLSSHDAQNGSSAIATSKLPAKGTDTSTAEKYPKYATETDRLTSFKHCGDIVIPPESLAASGFFYAGFGDCVRCFQCGLGLRYWSDEDDPWIEHCRFSKDCLFVKQVKGQEFVNVVQMAVQNSQNSENNQVSNNNCVPGHSNDIENLMNTNAAQSVLEMGYSSDTVQNALLALKNDGGTLNASVLFEKVEELQNSNSCETAAGTKPKQAGNRCSYVTRSSSPNFPVSHSTSYGETSLNSLRADRTSFQNTPTVISLNGTDDIWDLCNENQRMKDLLYCVGCGDELREVVFLSCPRPHLLFCTNCYLNHDLCPLCNTPVKALLYVRR